MQYSFYDQPQMSSSELYHKLKQLKKPELHLHFRGCLVPDLFRDLIKNIRSKKHYQKQGLLHKFPPQIQAMICASAHVKHFVDRCLHSTDLQLMQLCTQLWDYDQATDFFMSYLMSAGLWDEPYELFGLSDHVVSYLKDHHIVYAEIILSVSEYMMCGWSAKQIKILCDYTKDQAQKSGLEIRWIFDFVRNFNQLESIKRMEKLLEADIEGWIGITLGGEENKYPARNFTQLYQLAAQNHLHLTCHAGEHAPHSSVEDAVQILKCVRIGHGLTAHQNISTMDMLAQNNITLEMCPTSNVETQAIPSLTDHPIRSMIHHGVPISIASDDPGFFNTSLTKELYLCITKLNLSYEQILSSIEVGFAAAFDEDIRNRQIP